MVPPGLRPQHVQGVRTVRELCRGQVEGDKNNSTECALWPGALRGGPFVADIGTAGSCTLLVQMALPCLLFAPEPSSFCCKGGTDVSWSPPFDEIQEVFMPLLTHFGIKARLELLRRGLYPAGQGKVKLTVAPVRTMLTPLTLLNPGKVIKISCWVWAAGKKEAGELAAVVAGARAVLGSEFWDMDVTIQKRVETFQTSAFGTGIAITLVAITDTGCRFGATAPAGLQEAAAPRGDRTGRGPGPGRRGPVRGVCGPPRAGSAHPLHGPRRGDQRPADRGADRPHQTRHPHGGGIAAVPLCVRARR